MRHSLLILVLFAGCTSFAQIGETEYPARPDDWPVELYMADTFSPHEREWLPDCNPESAIPAGAVEIGTAEVVRMWRWSGTGGLKEMARRHGGDGVKIVGTDGGGLIGVILRWQP